MEWTSDNVEAAMTASAKALGCDKLTVNQSKVLRTFPLGSDVLPTGSGKSGSTGCIRYVKEDRYLYRSGSQPIGSSNEGSGVAIERRMKAVYGGDQCEMDRVYEGYYQMIFLTPESLLTTSKSRDVLLSDVYQRNLVAVVIDEAHCVKKW